MKITTEPLENRQLRLTIEVDEERSQRAVRQAARQISRQVNFPGFRKGKAPYDVVVQRYGEQTVRQEAAELLISEVYQEALEQEEIIPYAPGGLDDVSLDPFTFTFTTPLPPKVDLGDYLDYRLKTRQVRVRKNQIGEALDKIREQNAILESVERPAEMNDMVRLDLAVHTLDGQEILKVDDTRVLLESGNEDIVPGFANALVGVEAGEDLNFNLPLPEDFPQQDWRGQEAAFAVKVAEVYSHTLPGLDDDLARVAGNFDSLKELEKNVKEQLRHSAQQEADEEYAHQVLEDIVERAHVEYPPVMLESEIDSRVKQVEQRVKRETKLALEDFLRLQNRSMEDLQEELRPSAVKSLRQALVMGKVVEQEGLDVDEEEISTQIEEASASWGPRSEDVRASLSSEGGRRAVTNRLLGSKGVQRLIAIAKGEIAAPDSTEETTSHATDEAPSEAKEDTPSAEEEGEKEIL